jgi:DNA polymerase-3 subunit delta'
MFAHLIGNQRVKELLGRMLETGRVPGALLFAGEEAVGKKQFALELARALNCMNRKGREACGTCSACKRISAFNFPTSEDSDDWDKIIWTNHGDVGMVVARKRVLKVTQMREIEREANFRPFEGRARVFLVEEADRLNDSSSNALLKILEEPPPTSHIILITSRPAMLLTTIRSRCQAIRFSPVSAAEIERFLIQQKVAKGAEARLLARCANGSIGRALQSDLKSYKAHREPMIKLLSALAVTGDRTQLLRVAESMNEAKFKDDYEFRLELLETLIRDALILAVGGEAEVVNEDVLPELRKIAESVNPQNATAWIAAIEDVREQLIVNINRKPATDALFLKMAAS